MEIIGLFPTWRVIDPEEAIQACLELGFNNYTLIEGFLHSVDLRESQSLFHKIILIEENSSWFS